MTDQTETATTMWQDQHSGKRGHQLMTEKLASTIPALYANEKVADYDTVLAHAKLFSPYSNWTWFITELDHATGTCFGLVEGLERELGYFDLTELAETTVFGDVPAVERDLYWKPRTLGEIKRGSQADPPHGEGTEKGDAMNGDTGTENQPSDVVNIEEFLFGGVTEETSGDAPADVIGEDADTDAAVEPGPAEESPIAEAVDDAPADSAREPNSDGETADEPNAADDTGERTALDEKETSDELKVVLSIRGGRATIGVQRPEADPHIESFDDPDLFGLADEFPAVVARAKARWEEEPMHPAYVKPTPPPRQRNLRQQEPVQPPTNVEEAEQQQPETLRLF